MTSFRVREKREVELSAHSGGKGRFFFVRVAVKEFKFFGEFGGEKAHIPKERCDFVEKSCG